MNKGVIFVGGLIGTGKTSLAKALAQSLDVPYLDVDAIKKIVYPTDPDFEYNMKNNIPFSDATRIKTFNRAVEEMEVLSKMHPIIVVDETLHKKATRQVLFDGAKKHFGDSMLVWVKADEAVIKERLEGKAREGHILKDAFGMYLSMKNAFEDFESPDIVFENNGTMEESAAKLTDMVKAKITN